MFHGPHNVNWADKLNVILVLSNPRRFHVRGRLLHDCLKRIHEGGAGRVIIVETAYGDRPHEVTQSSNPNHLQLRTNHEIWIKENMINAGLAHLNYLDPKWEYACWADADVLWARPDWASETVHQLQHHPFVQMFSKAHDLGPDEEVFDTYDGFAWSYRKNLFDGDVRWDDQYIKQKHDFHPGYAWAFTRTAIDSVGGMLDIGILGSGDQHMANALIGRGRLSINPHMHPNYLAAVDRWEKLAERHIRRNIGYVSGSLMHHWHGPKVNRGYLTRWKILRDLQYDPMSDLKKDSQGLYELVDDGNLRSIELRDKLMAYFAARDEDCNVQMK